MRVLLLIWWKMLACSLGWHEMEYLEDHIKESIDYLIYAPLGSFQSGDVRAIEVTTVYQCVRCGKTKEGTPFYCTSRDKKDVVC